jgi:hypothetical protein
MPDKTAKRDIAHGARHLEEMGECWTAARRTLQILRVCAEKWKVELPEEADAAFARANLKWGQHHSTPSPPSSGQFGQPYRRIGQQPISEVLSQEDHARREQQQPTTSQPLHQQQMLTRPFSYGPQTFNAELRGGLSAAMAPSPVDVPDTRRSSGNLSAPPSNSTDFNRNPNTIRGSSLLTRTQQAAYNLLRPQNSRNGATFGGETTTPTDPKTYTASHFATLDNLMESQDWWYKDQSQLAMGFDNWNDPAQDYYAMDVNASTGPDATTAGLQQMTNAVYTPGSSNAESNIYGQQVYGGDSAAGAVSNTYNDRNMTSTARVNGAGIPYQRAGYSDESIY